MSLINQMLKDLEARHGVAAGDRVLDALPASAHGHATGRGAARLAWWLSALVIAMLLVLVAYLLWSRPVTGAGSGTGVPASMATAGTVSTARASTLASIPARPLMRASAGDDGVTAAPSRSPAPVATVTPASQAGSAISPAGHSGAQTEAPNPAPAAVPASARVSGEGPAAGQSTAQAKVQAGPRVSALPPNRGAESKPAPAGPAQAPASTRGGVDVGAKGMEAATPAAEAEDAAAAGDMHKRQRPLTPAQRAEQAYRYALAEFARGDASKGEQSLRAALRMEPDYLPAREVLAGVLLRGGRLVEAGELLREGLQRAPDHALFARLYARVLLAQGQTDAAVHLLERHRHAAGAQQPDYDALLAALYQRSGRYAQAAGLYRRLVILRPGAGAWWLGLGLALEGAGKSGQAVEAYRQALGTGALPAASRTYVQQRLSVLGGGAE